MGKTHRQEPRNGQFKKLKTVKGKRNKRLQQLKADLQMFIKFSNKPVNPATGLEQCYEDDE